VCVNALACPAVRVPAPAQEVQTWTTYLATLSRAPSANEIVPTTPELRFEFDVGRAPSGPLAVGDSVLVASTSDKKIAVLRRESGMLVWRRRLKGPGAGGPLFAGDRLFAASGDRDGAVHAYELESGKRLWARRIGPVVGPLGAFGATVYAATASGLVVALDSARGDIIWQRRFPQPLRSGVTVLGPHVLVSSDDSLYLVSRRTGERAAATRTAGSVIRPPAVVDQLLVTASPDGIVEAFELPTLESRWRRMVESPMFGSPSIARDTVFVTTMDGALWRIPIDAPWAATMQDIGIPMRATPAPVAGGVLVATVNGEILMLDGASDVPRWRLEADAALEDPPLVSDGTILLIDGTGTVRAWGPTRTEEGGT